MEKNIKIGSVMIRATPIMESLTGFMIAGFIVFSGTLISSGEIGVNNFSLFSSNDVSVSTYKSLATLNMAHFKGPALRE